MLPTLFSLSSVPLLLPFPLAKAWRHLGPLGAFHWSPATGRIHHTPLGGEEICFCPISSHYSAVFGLCSPLPPPPLSGVGGGTSPVLPPLPWLPPVLSPPWTAPGSLSSVAVLHPLLVPPSLLSPSWRGHQASWLRPSGLPWRTPTSAGAAGGGRLPGRLGVALPDSRGGGPPGRLPSRVGGDGTAAPQPPLTPASPALLLHGGLLLFLLCKTQSWALRTCRHNTTTINLEKTNYSSFRCLHCLKKRCDHFLKSFSGKSIHDNEK